MLYRKRNLLPLLAVAIVLIFGSLPMASAADFGPALSLSPEQQLTQPIVIVNTSYLNVRSGPGGVYSSIGVLPGGTELPVLGRNLDASWWQVQSDFGVGWVSAEYVIPRGDFRAVPVVEAPGVVEQPRAAVVGSAVTVYLAPSATASMLGMALVGSELPITGQTGDGAWWQVSTNVGSGWVMQDQVALRGNAATVPVVTYEAGVEAPAIIPAAPAAADTGDMTQPQATGNPVLLAYLEYTQIKDTPSFEGSGIGELEQGERVEVLGFSEGETFALIQYDDFRTGWVRVDDVAISDPTDPRTQVFFAGPGILDLKESATLASRTVTQISSGERLSVVDANADASWYLVEHFRGTGWIQATSVMLITSGSPTAQAPAAGGAVVQPPADGVVIQPAGEPVVAAAEPLPARTYVIVNTSFLNIRSGPGANYTTLVTVNGGTELDVNARTPDGIWLQVNTDLGAGWVNSEYVIFRGDYGNIGVITYADAVGVLTQPVAVVSAPINVYLGPGVETGLLGTAPAGLELPVIGRTADGGWFQVSTQSGAGWVLASTVTFRGDAALVPIVG